MSEMSGRNPGNTPSDRACPEAVLRRIPWYPDQGLSEAERGEIEAHAASCEECRREIDMIRGEEVVLPAAPEPEALYARILGRIEAEADTPEPTRGTIAVPVGRRSVRSASRLGLAASLILALGVGVLGGVLLQRSELSEEVYRTAAEVDAAAPRVEGIGLDVIFRGDATSEQITAALRAIRAEVVSGPSRLGVYRLMLTSDGDGPAAAKLLLADGTGVATFAEPVQD